ncbi:tetratricopeptide repeat protein [Marivita hallyeonensis]|uniref:Tetratricopeptide repeat-containing protein n=1 Tax=Marivita hallyeonensis TaxID=996342 RepID=A0A1M5W2F3_9RHOB|nr:tetratricopeptide repeat protein [Marivita hallyeonensis]SHH81608.1 Tetratricopeptide repeat-containing protein [Marivita hallyeonensis]
MALAVYGEDGKGGESRKADIQKLEAGKSAKPTARTLKKFRDASIVSKEEIDACRTAEEIELARYAEHLFEVIKEAVAQTEVSDDLALELTERYAAGNPEDFEGAVRGLMRALEIAAKRPTTGNLDADVNDIIAEVKRLNDVGQMEDAARALDEALEAGLAEEELRKAGNDALIREGIDQAILMRDVEKAAALLVRQVERETPSTKRQFQMLHDVAVEWTTTGRDRGLAFDLEVSIALSRMLMDRASDRDERGQAANRTGNALSALGERESGTARLEEAVAAYRAALEEYTRERVPLNWAMTQNNLGNALSILGKRESGTARLEEAVTAYRAALEERTRERVPLDWAMTQNNLSNALLALGERDSGTARLEEAVTAYRAALEERTRERVPLGWATTQNNLGNALQSLGERESGTTRLEEAVVAYRAALEEYTRERAPLEWAESQNNLGNVLQILGGRESGTARLEEAVAAYRAALEEFSRERVPFQWATTTENLGLAYEAFFDKTGDRAQLEEAIALVRAAREVFEEAGASFYIEKSDRILADLEAKL